MLTDDFDAAIGMSDDVRRDAAEQQALHRAKTASANEDGIGIPAIGLRQDFLA
jgi:hypothetical protein